MKYTGKVRGLVIASLLSMLAPVASASAATRWCRPGDLCWPRFEDWQHLKESLRGKLERPQTPLASCEADASSVACAAALEANKNPLALEDASGAMQSSGWLDAWTNAASSYAVVAEGRTDVLTAVNFARQHNLRLVVKSTGHDGQGRSNAPDSLLLWMHHLRQVTMRPEFVPVGCASRGVQAVTIGAGARWFEAYDEVTVKHGRYVQGGGCTTVGVGGGFLQGGGFGSWSKMYGTAAANLLEAEVVTTDGKILIANACQNSDLFWALRGGGGGTYGVVTKVTLRTYALPSYFGWVHGTITAKDDASFQALVEQFLRFYRQALNNEHWGEQVTVRGNNSLVINMAFAGLTAAQAEQVWQPLRAWAKLHPSVQIEALGVFAVPGDKMWNHDFITRNFPNALRDDGRAGAPLGYWWTGDSEQVSTYWYAYQSRWLPLPLFAAKGGALLADALVRASHSWPVTLHFNKGLAGASKTAMQLSRETSLNPAVHDAAALAIVAASGEGTPGLAGLQPDLAAGRAQAQQVTAAMAQLRAVAPHAGTYSNEADFFEANWQRSFWGENYGRLLAIKRKYDPLGILRCHHCVGDEAR